MQRNTDIGLFTKPSRNEGETRIRALSPFHHWKGGAAECLVGDANHDKCVLIGLANDIL